MADMEHRMTEVEEKVKELERRQNNLDELVGTVKELVVREEHVETSLKEIKDDVKGILNRPAEHWNEMVKTVISVLVAGLVGFILAKIGL